MSNVNSTLYGSILYRQAEQTKAVKHYMVKHFKMSIFEQFKALDGSLAFTGDK